MSEEEKIETADEFDEAFGEATSDQKEEKVEELEEDEESEEVTEEKKKEDEKPPEEKTDWKAESERLKTDLEKKAKEADANKRFADDMARQNAEQRKKQLEEDEKKKKEELETMSEEISAFIDEYPEAQRAIEHFSKVEVNKAMSVFNDALKEACGGQDPVKFIKGMIEYKDQSEFERTVMLGYIDNEGKYVKGHPDVYEITRSQGFADYVQNQVKNDSTFIERQNNPTESIRTINDYKKQQLKKAGEKDKEKLNEQKEEMEDQMTATVKEGVRKGKEKGPDKDDFDGAFEEATGT